MPAYEITYRDSGGSLTAKIETQCASDREAKVLAHAMRMDGARQFEVWRDEALVYARPHYDASIAPRAMEIRL